MLPFFTSASPQGATQTHRVNWESMKTFIRKRYLIDNEDISTILKDLEGYGYHVTYAVFVACTFIPSPTLLSFSLPWLSCLFVPDVSRSKRQLENKLNTWHFRKKLSPEIWRHIRAVICGREADNKKTIVVLSGREIPAERVTRETRRSQLLTLKPG